MSSPDENRKSKGLAVAVGIPTRGRLVILKETLADLSLQTFAPRVIMVAYLDPTDIGDAPEFFPKVHFLQTEKPGGSCSQRNRLLHAVPDDCDLVFIMDDDCYLQREYLERMVETFAGDPTVVGGTGRILENGATGPGLSGEYARRLLRSIPHAPTLAEEAPRPAFNTDGCNMAFRMEVLRHHGIRFDESMPGYAWYEDIDFSRRFLPYGRLVLVPGAQAVHLGAKVGKTSGLRYGYSQVANPVYLARKGTYPWSHAFRSVARNFAANLLHSIKPEPFIDRHGRLHGNLLAFQDWISRKIMPDRILRFK